MIYDPPEIPCIGLPGGERHLDRKCSQEDMDIQGTGVVFRLRNSDDVMDMLLVSQWMTQHNIPKNMAYIPYLPYARQDRNKPITTAFSLKVMAGLINSMGFTNVFVYEPHSDVAPALINNCYVRTMDKDVLWFIDKMIAEGIDAEDIHLVAPDASASKRVARLDRGHFIQCMKHRDPHTGRVNTDNIYGDPQQKHCVIVDDICDGGATFIPIAKRLYDLGAKSVSLFVAHGIFSKGLQSLIDAGITRICCSDSWCQLPSDKYLTVFPVLRYT